MVSRSDEERYGMKHVDQLAQRWQLLARLLGAGLIFATGGLHLDLYLTGYRTIPTIGWLFLLQVVASFGLAALVVVTSSRLVSAVGAGFALSTLGGYVLSQWVGLFGFKEVPTTAGAVAGSIEVSAFAVLGFLAVAPSRRPGTRSLYPARPLDEGQQARAGRLEVLVGAATLVATALFVVAVSTGAGPRSSVTGATGGRPELEVRQIAGKAVLTNAAGFTLYRFALDGGSKSRCYGTCAVYWPPLTGAPRAGPGVTGTLGTIKRSDGSLQATYDGHPLYTYIGDSAPGQASGNRVNLNGGLWYDLAVSR
jgi:predicted lipoprotein with Yx(FWY)xxD motif